MMDFKEYAKQQFEEWKTTGKCSDAVRLNKLISAEKKYFDESNPSFFYGDIQSSVVLIHHNPKRDKDYKEIPCNHKNFGEFWDYYAFFGKNKYSALNKDEKRYGKFDLKQIRFLKPFNILPFKENNKNLNLEIVIDKKLQLDLIPFGSPSFEYSKIGKENIQPYFDRLFKLVLSAKRDYIIFCGVVFREIEIPGVIKTKIHKFKLIKKDGSFTNNEYEIINMEIDYKGERIHFSIAPHYAIQGLPIDKYGEKITELYKVY
jgi:hypothetical protein